MSAWSDIEWCDATWNPVRGCVPVSRGCKHCYALVFAERWRGVPGHPFEHGFDLRLVPEHLDDPLKWKAGRRIFISSMSDLFQDGVPDTYIDQVFARMVVCPRHRFLVLSKRHERMREYVCGPDLGARLQEAAFQDLGRGLREKFLQPSPDASAVAPWIALGVSVEDRRFGLPRIDALRETPASLRFLSIEPLLEDLGELDLRGIHWVIVGGESGLGAREMKEEWVDAIHDQAVAAGVPFFFKQWGGLHKKRRGRVLHGRTHDAMPTLWTPQGIGCPVARGAA